MFDKLFVLSQYITPQLGVSNLAGRLADNDRSPALKNRVIKWFIGRYGVDMSEAAEPNPEAYATFNDFFTRELKPGIRPWRTAKKPWSAPLTAPSASSARSPETGFSRQRASRSA